MDTSSIQTLLTLILFVLGLLSLFLISHPRGNRRSNTLLGVLLLSWSMMFLDSLGIISGWTLSYTRLAFWGNQFFWVIGPLIYFYTRSVLDPDFRLEKKHFWHFLPFLLLLFLSQAAWQTVPDEIRTLGVQNAYAMQDAWLGAIILLMHSQFAIYLWLSFRELKSYRNRLANNFSAEDQVQLPWLRNLLWGILIIIVLGLIQNVLRFLSDSSKGYEITLLISGIALLAFFGWLVWVAMRKPEIFSGLSPLKLDTQEKKMDQEEARELQQVADRLQTYMREEQVFLQPDLSIKELAAKLSIPPRELSRSINRIHGQSFFDYINRHRIELAQEKIREAADPKITVLEIMYEVGFQSKSSFNTAFKKFSGMTPTQWKAQVRK